MNIRDCLPAILKVSISLRPANSPTATSDLTYEIQFRAVVIENIVIFLHPCFLRLACISVVFV